MTRWDVVDVDLAYAFYADSQESRDAYIKAIELMRHRFIVREVPLDTCVNKS